MGKERATVALLLVLLLLGSVTALASTLPTIRVYSDNTVEVEFTYVKREPIDAPSRFRVDISVEDRKTAIGLNVYIDRYSDPSANISFVANFEGGRADRVVSNVVRFAFDDRDEYSWITMKTAPSIEAELDLNTLVARVSGRVELSAGGEAEQLLTSLMMLNKQSVEELLRYQNITWVEIEKLDVEVAKEAATVDFAITLRIGELAEKELTDFEVAALKAAIARLSHPFRGELRLEILQGDLSVSAHLAVEENINEILEGYVALYNIYKLYSARTFGNVEPSPPIPLPAPPHIIDAGLTALSEFVKRFKVAPSAGYLQVTAEDDAVKLEGKTPRIVKKGATTPADTLAELYDFATWATNVLREHAPAELERVADLAVRVEGVGVKITLNEAEVSEVRFSDIPNLEVVVAPATTPTTPATIPTPEEQVTTTIAVAGVIVALIVIGVALVALRRK